MFGRQLNPHHSFQFGKDNAKALGKIGLTPTYRPIMFTNPSEVKKEAVSSIQRVKR